MTDYCSITKEVEFDAGHRVPSHAGKCRNPHGHRYRVVAELHGPIIENTARPDDGMLVDFGSVKQLLNDQVVRPFDHAFLVWEHDHDLLDALDGRGWQVCLTPYVPTAENLARMIFDRVAPLVLADFGHDLRLAAVTVWETPTSSATYSGPMRHTRNP